jgi:lipopolysaccharide biosynthesis glycosyltransferase
VAADDGIVRTKETGMITLCSLWDSAYHKKGMALLDSLRRHQKKFRLFVLALDQNVYDQVNKQANVIAANLENLERENADLQEEKANRTYTEYVWGLASYFTAWCADIFDPDSIAYIDADCYLFNPLDELYQEVIATRIAITPHRYTPSEEARLRGAGVYNVGWVYFAREGYQCLRDWRSACLEWCYRDVKTDGRFADQGYLNEWPQRYGAHVVQHLGANLAPWNQEQYTYDGLTVSDGKRTDPIMFYHFHGYIDKNNWTGYRLNLGVRRLYDEYSGRVG